MKTTAAWRKTATKVELRNEIANLRRVGRQMANLCFNFAQTGWTLTKYDRKTMDQLRQEWDQIPRADKTKP